MRKLKMLLYFFIVIQFCFANNNDKKEQWDNFKKKYGKFYNADDEEKLRKTIFLQNLNEIEEHNERYKNNLEIFEVGINEYSDMRIDELTKMMMTVEFKDELELLKIHRKKIIIRGPLPDYVNWVERGFNTSVRLQGGCGSCYAFSAVAAIEAQFYIKYKSYLKISEQDVLDCSRYYGNLGCTGGWPSKVFDYAKEQGIGFNKHFLYKDKEYQCIRKSVPYLKIKEYYRIEINNENEMKYIIATIGPITVAIDGSNANFYRYRKGIYYDIKCKINKFTHIVLVVGYGTTENGEDYWIIKNSWGYYWGNKGYALMARNKNNHCGIATHAYYVIL